MKFGPNHYVPVLKIKRGEKKALEMLAPAIVRYVTPLLEIVEHKPEKQIAKHLDTAFKGMAPAVAPFGRYFLDTREIATDGAAVASEAFRRALALGHPFTPITGITRTVDVAAALRVASNGIALRITRQEFENGVVPSHLPAFMTDHGLACESTDLLVDLGPVEDMIPTGISRMSEQFLRAIPDIGRWRTLTLLASTFPLSMKGVARNSHAFEDRSEWLSWRDGPYSRRRALARLPTFGDCAIQHPRGVEGFDPTKMQMSAAIRYTVDDKWLLVKGESTNTTPARVQFPRLAARLTTGSLATHFSSQDHCAGCRDMVRASSGARGFGSPEAWRRLGTAHHITRASQLIRALTWP